MKIAVLVSGGVDSSLALALLKKAGHDVHAFYLKIWLEEEIKFLGTDSCPWQEDLEYVEKVCKQFDVPLEVVPMQREYFDTIVKYAINEVKHGRTPNPDVLCNNHVKFGLFFDKIDSSFEKVATGHYAQLTEIEGKMHLKQAPDPIKDQTFFLSHLSEETLRKAMFPIGHLSKNEVRNLANELNLPNKNRKDSQGLCFLGKIKYRDFIGHYVGEKEGDLLEFETENVLGKHKGFWFYTIGQRKDIRLPDGPWFVVKKDKEKNIVYVSKNYFSEDKDRNELIVENLNFFAGHIPKKQELKVKLRHGENFHNCKITPLENGKLHLKLDETDQGIAPGQFTAFYDEDICLGSGVISDTSTA